MRRILLFSILLALFLVVTFPWTGVVQKVVSTALATQGVNVTIAEARAALPFGLRLEGVRADDGFTEVELESVYVGLLGGLTVEGCSGVHYGRWMGGVSLTLDDASLRQCLTVSGLDIQALVRGTVELNRDGSGSVDLEAREGVFAGFWPGPNGTPLGEWPFELAALAATFDPSRVEAKSGRVLASGLELVLDTGEISDPASRNGTIRVDFRGRAVPGSLRGKAMLGLLPRGPDGADGWRRYRVSGGLSAPKVIAR